MKKPKNGDISTRLYAKRSWNKSGKLPSTEKENMEGELWGVLETSFLKEKKNKKKTHTKSVTRASQARGLFEA